MEDLALGSEDILSAAEVSDVGVSDICDDSHIGLRDPDKIVDLTQMVHAHLHNSRFVVRINPEYCQRNSDMIVEISIRFECAESLGEH